LTNTINIDGVDGDADALGPLVFGIGLGAAALTKRIGNEICSVTRTRTNKEKKAVLVSVCWLKRKLLKKNIIIQIN
jgi:hypothetical protein